MAGDSKTEKATPKKRKDERKKGNVFQSKDIVNALSILGVFFTLKLMMPSIYNTLSNYFKMVIGYIKQMEEMTKPNLQILLVDSIWAFVNVTALVMLIAMFIGVVAAGAQTQFLFSYESMKFKFNRLSPLQGIKRLFSLRSIVELLKSMVKIVIIGAVLYGGFQDIVKDAMKMMSVDLLRAVVMIMEMIMDIVIKLSLVFIGLSGFDYLYQWWDYERQIKMSKQDLKEEYKHTEGDPQIKGKIKDAQRKMSMKRMMQQVPTADVVVRNPTHYAIALKYDIDHDYAPTVVAKGEDYMALRIIEVAEKHGVPVTENRPLARALYELVDLGHEVPADYYAVIAEILAWVYTLKQEKQEGEKR